MLDGQLAVWCAWATLPNSVGRSSHDDTESFAQPLLPWFGTISLLHVTGRPAHGGKFVLKCDHSSFVHSAVCKLFNMSHNAKMGEGGFFGDFSWQLG